jgi:hypothetical protein
MKRSFAFTLMLLSYSIAGAVILHSPAHAHTMNDTECQAVAHDARVIASERDAGTITYKMQIEQLAALLPICRDHQQFCVYKDDADDAQADTMIGWIYANQSITPAEAHDKTLANCQEELMESVRAEHGTKE